jgi:2-keto-4-pentenoate hydratase/2-oxohepta-3-ene-1,7-dioic acid hydratase in catechol pathway
VLAIGKNYADHAAEMGSDTPDSPILFMKPATSVIGPGGPIIIPPDSMEVHHEGEVAVFIGSLARNLRA